jgi:hypothetical protein
MDFSNRGSQQSPAAPRTSGTFAPEGGQNPKGSGRAARLGKGGGKLQETGAKVMLVVVSILVLAVIGILVISNQQRGEGGYVDSGKYQAVFLTNDQVYFGKVSELNSKYIVLNDIYYLRTQSTDANAQANNNVSLVKLGCELHKPYDTMVINRTQVQFWENLQDSGQVATAVKNYQKTNPNNTCSNTASGAASSSSVQGSAPAATPAPATTTPTTTKKP